MPVQALTVHRSSTFWFQLSGFNFLAAPFCVILMVLVVANILSKGTKLREYAKGVENDVRQVELDSIQDYIKESDNLVSLHDQIRDCDNILSQMETLLCGFQAEIGSISSEIKSLQEKSMDMGLKLKNRKTIPTEFARDIVPLSETISLKLAGDRTWTVGIREEKDRLVLEDEWEDFVKENTLKLNDTLYDHEDKVHAESLVFIDGAADDCVAKTQLKESLDEDNAPKSEPVEEVQEEWTQLEFSGAAGRLIEGNASKIDPSSKQHKISKQRIRHSKKHAKKRQMRDRDNPVRNRHEAPTRWHNPPSSTRRSGRDKGRGQKKEKTAPNKPAQEGEDSAEEFGLSLTRWKSSYLQFSFLLFELLGESYYVGATIEHDLTYATYFRSQKEPWLKRR
ncbi:hypothetical protein Syun_015051 [Stephania yunnanensis]|uniref:TF-B3 domain-containing protein n=1 Tax=Stephania yunnanensis TaxID=152371 RepID=A0AAP0JLJ7_9MAGN